MEPADPTLDALLGHVPGLEVARFDTTGRCVHARGRRADRHRPGAAPFPSPIGEVVAVAVAEAIAGTVVREELPDGEDGIVALTASPLPEGGALVTLRDVTEERRAPARTAAANARFRAAFDLSPVSMTLLGADLLPLRINAATTALTGYSRERHEAGQVLDAFDPAEIGPVMRRLTDVAEGRTSAATLEHTLVRADGRRIWVRAQVHPVTLDDGTRGLLAVTADVTAERRLAEELQQLVTRDPLTGLLNREGLEAALLEHASATTPERPHALLVADVDDFAQVNERLGTAQADLVLREVAEALRATVRDTDVVARVGGDEFAVVLAGQDVARAGCVAEAVMDRFAEAVARHGGDAARLGVSLSIGVASLLPGTTPARALAAAGVGVYAAKAAGKGRWVAAP